jgi:quercetin 2,3-dioxygenase
METISSAIKAVKDLGFPWVTQDPFLFCVFHEDFYPKGNGKLGPDASLGGRSLGNDFTIKDGWRMYHGSTIPGFPSHPHRGFETVTVVNKGLVDHSDSLGAAGRFGNGDVQWMTAGKGVQHSEMFPLLKDDAENPLELFQIWLNLPKAKKFSEPHYKMLWSEDIQFYKEEGLEVQVIAGKLGNINALDPTPDSWAASPENEVAIWNIKLDVGKKWSLPTAGQGINRSLYFFQGKTIKINDEEIDQHLALELHADQDVEILAGADNCRLLLLQGKPINEPVAQYGPFVMNEQHEIQETMMDYQRTQFGGWPWSSPDPTHGKERGRFAKYADGKEDIR